MGEKEKPSQQRVVEQKDEDAPDLEKPEPSGETIDEVKTGDTDTALLEKIQELKLLSTPDLVFVTKANAVTVSRKKWPSSNLRLVSNVASMTPFYVEDLPKFKVEYPDPWASLKTQFYAYLTQDLGVMEPFVFDPPKAYYDHSNLYTAYNMEGFNLEALIHRLRSERATTHELAQLNQFRKTLTVSYQPCDLPGIRSSSPRNEAVAVMVDGRLRSAILTLVERYHRSRLVSYKQKVDQFRVNMPSNWNVDHLPQAMADAVTYEEPERMIADGDPYSLISDLSGRIERSLVHTVLFKNLTIYGLRPTQATAEAASAITIKSNVISGASKLVSGISTSTNPAFLMKVIKAAAYRNFPLKIQFDGEHEVCSGTELMASLLLILYIPRDHVAEASLIQARRNVVSVLADSNRFQRPDDPYQGLPRVQGRHALIRLLEGFDAPVDIATLQFPHNPNATYRWPFLYNGERFTDANPDGRKALIGALADGLTSALRRSDEFRACGMLLKHIMGRRWTDDRSRDYVRTIELGASMNSEQASFKDDNLVSTQEILSFFVTYTGVNPPEPMVQAMTMLNVRRHLAKCIAEAAAYASDFEMIARKITDTVVREQRQAQTLETIYMETSKNATFRVLLRILDPTDEKKGLKELMAYLKHIRPTKAPIRQLVDKIFDTTVRTHSMAFGVSQYLILARVDIPPERTRFNDIFSHHPFRGKLDPSYAMNKAQLSVLNATEFAKRLESGPIMFDFPVEVNLRIDDPSLLAPTPFSTDGTRITLNNSVTVDALTTSADSEEFAGSIHKLRDCGYRSYVEYPLHFHINLQNQVVHHTFYPENRPIVENVLTAKRSEFVET